MRISVNNPEAQTTIFIVLFLLILLLSIKKRSDKGGFSPALTDELKGFAILTVIFGHIGYFLAYQNQFLFPLSILSGVGVNLFLILSGFGLTVSALKKPLSVKEFYQKRFQKLFAPFWIVLFCLLILDGFILHKSYPTQSIFQMFFGWFPKADLYQSLDSPLWYFTFIFFYYLIFPLVTFKKLIFISPILIYILSNFLLSHKLPITIDIGVLELYKDHVMAFPLGVALALVSYVFSLKKIEFKWMFFARWLFIPLLAWIISYFAIHSGVGESVEKEQKISIITSVCIILLGIIKPMEFKLLKLFGKYSYEIYLIHWPILYRYDLIYKVFPAWIATGSYLFIFILLSNFLQKASHLFAEKLKFKKSQ
jgi:peptidoglycan/LPS O-acetylase OafA/YrhL